MRKAIQEMNGKQINGRPIRIKKAAPKERIEKKIRKITEKKQNRGKPSATIQNAKGEANGKGNVKPDNKPNTFKHKPISKPEKR